MGKDKAGNIKAKNTWLHETNWDLVVFDEYHFGAWRDNAKELFEGEDDAEAQAELRAEFNPNLEGFNEDLDELGAAETEFLPITTKAYLYLSGTPFKALATGEFIEEQIFNWTYTDEQRAKQDWAELHPAIRNPYAALPEMRLLTYQMPDELIAIANQGEFDEFDLGEFFGATGAGASGHVHAQERGAEVAGHHPRRLQRHTGRQPEARRKEAAVPVLRRAAAALPEPLVLVPADRGVVPRDGEPACREAEHVLPRLRGPDRRRGWCRGRSGGASARARGDRQRLTTPRPSPCPAASSPPG